MTNAIASMRKVTVGYQDGCLFPLWVTTSGVRVARWSGASAVWVPDHFMGFAPKWMWKPEILPAARVIHSMDALFDPVPILTQVALRHRGVLVGTSVTEPIRRHPMSLAQTFVTLDHISGGRAVLGIGNGLRENTEPYGLDCEKRVARLEEAVRIIRMLWNSDGRPVTFEGKFWKLRDAVFDLPLYRGAAPRLFVGAHFPRMLRICGAHADGWLPGEKVQSEEYAHRLGVIRESAAAAKRTLSRFTAAQTLLVAFGENRNWVLDRALVNPYCAYMAMGLPPAVWRECSREHPCGEAFMGFLDLVPSRVTPELVSVAQQRLNVALLDRLFYMGSPAEILKEVAPLAAAGCNHFILANMGAAFTGRGLADLRDMWKLMRGLRRLEAPSLE